MGLINEDLYTAQNGVTLANTYVKLGIDSVQFMANPGDKYTAATTMVIYKDAQAYADGCTPLEYRNVVYEVPDPTPVYRLLYGSAVAAEGWARTRQYATAAAGLPTAATAPDQPTAVTTPDRPTVGSTADQPSSAPTTEQPSSAASEADQPPAASTSEQPSSAPTTDQPPSAASTSDQPPSANAAA